MANWGWHWHFDRRQIPSPHMHVVRDGERAVLAVELSGGYGDAVALLEVSFTWRRPRPTRVDLTWPSRYGGDVFQWWRRDFTLERPLPEGAPVWRPVRG